MLPTKKYKHQSVQFSKVFSDIMFNNQPPRDNTLAQKNVSHTVFKVSYADTARTPALGINAVEHLEDNFMVKHYDWSSTAYETNRELVGRLFIDSEEGLSSPDKENIEYTIAEGYDTPLILAVPLPDNNLPSPSDNLAMSSPADGVVIDDVVLMEEPSPESINSQPTNAINEHWRPPMVVPRAGDIAIPAPKLNINKVKFNKINIDKHVKITG